MHYQILRFLFGQKQMDFGSGLHLTDNTGTTRSVKSLTTKSLQNVSKMEEGVRDIDGGWALVIFVTAIFGHIFLFGVILSNGILYTAILDYDLGSSPSFTALPFACTLSFVYLYSPLSHFLRSCFGSRAVIFLGCFMSTTGLIGTSFITNVLEFFISYGILCGIGWALVYTVLIDHLADYFVVYRKIATMGVSIGTGIGSFIYPCITTALITEYSWQGAYLIFGALNLNLLVPFAAFVPNAYTEKLRAEEAKTLKLEENSLDEYETFEKEEIQLEKTQKNACIRCIYKSHLNFLTDFRFDLCLLAMLFINIATSAGIAQLSNLAKERGQSQGTISLLVSLYGLSNAVNRFFLIFLGYLFPWLVISYYVIVTLGYAGASLLLGYSTNLLMLTFGSVGIGFFSAWFVMTPELVFLTVGAENFGVGWSLILFSCGIGMLMAPPLSGWVYQMTDSYTISFLMAGIFAAGSSVSVLLIWYENTCSPQHRRKFKPK